jgi:hypothetical protein
MKWSADGALLAIAAADNKVLHSLLCALNVLLYMYIRFCSTCTLRGTHTKHVRHMTPCYVLRPVAVDCFFNCYQSVSALLQSYAVHMLVLCVEIIVHRYMCMTAKLSTHSVL